MAKKTPSKITDASTGNGSPGQSGGVLWRLLGGVHMTTSHTRMLARGCPTYFGNQVDFMLTELGPSKALAKAGNVKVLAIGDIKRLKEFPDLPVRGEVPPGCWIGTVFTLIARSSTPKPIVDKLKVETVKALRTKDARGPMEPHGYDAPTETRLDGLRSPKRQTCRWTTSTFSPQSFA